MTLAFIKLQLTLKYQSNAIKKYLHAIVHNHHMAAILLQGPSFFVRGCAGEKQIQKTNRLQTAPLKLKY